MEKDLDEQESCKVLNLIDTCKHKKCMWHEEPCADCKYNPSRYYKTEPRDRYEEVKSNS